MTPGSACSPYRRSVTFPPEWPLAAAQPLAQAARLIDTDIANLRDDRGQPGECDVSGDTQRIEIIDDGVATSVAVDGELVGSVPNDRTDAAGGCEVGLNAEVALRNHTPSEWRMVGELWPADEAMEELEVDPGYGGDAIDVWVYQDEITITVDGAPWRWAAARSDGQWSVAALVPDQEFEPVFGVEVYNAGSMTGSAWTIGLRRFGPVLCAFEKEEDEEPYWVEFSHGHVEMSSVVGKILARVEAPVPPTCPCEEPHDPPEDEYEGWEASLTTADWLDDRTVAKLMEFAWIPCDLHADECSLEQAGRRWRWSDGWTRSSGDVAGIQTT